MSETYYKENFIRRIQHKVITTLKQLPEVQFNAVWIAVAFFVILIAFFEYKVYEATLTQTGDFILSISVLTVTAAGGLIAELFLHRNKKATEDQRMIADTIFYISIVTSAVAGFAVWAQSSGTSTIYMLWFTFTLPAYGQFVFTTITIVSVIDALLLRSYIRGDVDNQHSRDVNVIDSQRREADLQVERDLMQFRTKVKTTSERRLKIEQERAKLRSDLNEIYSGNVPSDVMAKAMQELDSINMDEQKPAAPVKKSPQMPLQRPPMSMYASDTKQPELFGGNGHGGDGDSPNS